MGDPQERTPKILIVIDSWQGHTEHVARQVSAGCNLAACGMVLVTLPKCTPGFEHAGVHWGPTIKATDNNMRPLPPETLDPEAQQAFHHHGANVVRVTRRLYALAMARGNRWPTEKDREARMRFEADRPPSIRTSLSADPIPRSA